MISLKKYLDGYSVPFKSEPETGELLAVVLTSYRSALQAIGQNGVRACRAVGSELQQNLADLITRLNHDLTPSLVQQAEGEVEQHLRRWGGQSEEYLKAKANDVKELLIVLARTAESLGKRDQHYTQQFTQFTGHLRAIADLEDLGQVRASLVQKANEMRGCVEQMQKDSEQSLNQLQAEVANYETKLQAAEHLALSDELTGLANRRNVEKRIAWRIDHQQMFSVAILDVNDFKQINDRHGHLAGDDLLRQFAQELSANMRSTDLVGRWSGDEFVVVLDCNLGNAVAQMDRMRQWVFGNYTVQLPAGGAPVKISVEASIGVAQWQAGESLQQLVSRADSAMYKQKKLAKQRASVTPE